MIKEIMENYDHVESPDAIKSKANLRRAVTGKRCDTCRHWQSFNMACELFSHKAGVVVKTRPDEVCDWYHAK